MTSFSEGKISSLLKAGQQRLAQIDDQTRLCGLIDTAGILREEPSDVIAQTIAQTLQKDVLFFGRREGKNDPLPDHLMVWKQGKKTPEFIGNTTEENIRKRGIDPMNVFVYYDQRHCEATDIRQRPDAINILTFDEKMPSRTLFQGTLRLRQFFDGQSILPMIAEKAQKCIPHGDQLEGLLRQTLFSQARNKAQEAYRSYEQKITHLARQGALNILLRPLHNSH